MNLWKLEWLRLTRTRRLVALVGVYAFFGLLGPFTARYLSSILERFGGDIQITFPAPVPADGITQYVSNAGQIGVLVVVLVAAGALAVDARPEWAVFLRTRTSRPRDLLSPRYLVTTGAAGGAFVLGTLIAWYETAVLLGGVSVGGLLAGMAYGILYLAFAVAITAAAAARAPSVLGAAGIAILALLLLPVIGLVQSIGEWLPSYLVGALDGLVRDGAVSDYLRAAGVTAVATAGLLWLAERESARREL